MVPPRRCRRIAAAIAVCLVAALISTNRADAFMPGEWDGQWISEFGHSSGAVSSQIYLSESSVTGEMALTNSQCTNEITLADSTLQGGVLNCECLLFPLHHDVHLKCFAGLYPFRPVHYLLWRPIPTTQGAFSLSYSGPWQDAVDSGNGWWYDWFGWFNTNAAPWIYHQTLGWLYPYGTSADNIWFYDADMNSFCWTSQAVFPCVYRTGRNSAWLYYDVGSSSPPLFFNFSTGLWEAN